MSPTTSVAPLRRALVGAVCLLGLALLPSSVFGQGCVIARGGGASAVTDGTGFLEPKQWQLSFAFRHFESDRHFVGDDEQPQRQAQGTQVVNNSFFYDTTATYAWSKRLNLSLTVPFVYHDRSSLYEHSGNSGARYHTQSAGIGDVRVGANYWVLDPEMNHRRWNVSVGLGIKTATGAYDAKDIFMRPTGPTSRYVDSSIQPGDGGLGFTAEVQGYLMLFGNFSAYANGFYLFSPEERVEKTGFSIPDAYMARGGIDYRVAAVKGLVLSLGARNEGVVAHDLFGGSRGSRRPGFAVAVEPGVTYTKGRYTGTITVPVAVHRNRVTTFGSARAGDAAFADYTINTSLSIRL